MFDAIYYECYLNHRCYSVMNHPICVHVLPTNIKKNKVFIPQLPLILNECDQESYRDHEWVKSQLLFLRPVYQSIHINKLLEEVIKKKEI